MRYRQFGNTDLSLSEIGFGSWAMGGESFGAVTEQDAMSALARAESLGCNFVDTAAVYGEAELRLGKFLKGRREHWLVASKFSSSKGNMRDSVHAQLKRLGTDYLDFYQIHWAPGEPTLYEELYRLKQEGKVRYVGVSLSRATEIDYVIEKTHIDGFQMAISLLDPQPFLRKREKIAKSGLGVIARSCLHWGFLTGKYSDNAAFTDPQDKRSEWSAEKILQTAKHAKQFSALATADRTLAQSAIQYPLSFSEVSSVIVSCKSAEQVEKNFAATPPLNPQELATIQQTQQQLDLLQTPIKTQLKEFLSGIKRRLK